MRTIDLTKENLGLGEAIEMARKGPVLVLATDGKEFFLSEADDFEREVETLRSSPVFQRFLDMRSASKAVTPLAEIEREIDRDLTGKG
jgi:hypothetical protein